VWTSMQQASSSARCHTRVVRVVTGAWRLDPRDTLDPVSSGGVRRVVTGIVAAAVLAGCAGDGGPQPSLEGLDPEMVARGERLYLQHCAVCHGRNLEGAPNWQTPNPDRSYPPPPHDSSGHTWHHPDRVLLEIVRDGSPWPQSRMPAFGHVLSDDDILAVLEFFRAHWGPEEREFQRRVTEQDPG
jgi:S-disulfanyl-L-cysteine oxidoreductase SoxD